MRDWLEEGKQALARADWHAARCAFQNAPDCAEKFEGLGVVAWWLDDAPSLFEARVEAYRLYRQAGDRRGAARVAIQLAESFFHFRGEVAVARGWLRRAHRLLEGLETVHERGWLAVWEADLDLETGEDLEQVLRSALEGARIGRALGDVDLEMTALALEGVALVTTGEIVQGMRRLDEANAAVVAGEMSDPIAIGLSYCYLMRACERMLDFERATQWFARVEEFCARLKFVSLASVCRAEYAGVLVWQGAWRDAESQLKDALDQLSRLRPGTQTECFVRLAELRRQQGRLDEAAALLERSEGHPLELLVRARTALDRGDAEAALRSAQRYLRRAPASRKPDRAAALEVSVRAQAALGRAAPEETLEELRAIAESVGTAPLRASVHLAEGAVADVLGDHARACESFEDAIELLARVPYQQACARLELARSYESIGDSASAKSERAKAERTFSELGVTRPRATNPPRTHGVLTPREMEILPLLAQGLSNQQIGKRLHVSAFTIKRHVANILTKLALPSRAAVAAYAAKNRLV